MFCRQNTEDANIYQSRHEQQIQPHRPEQVVQHTSHISKTQQYTTL